MQRMQQRPHYRPRVVKMAVELPDIRFDAISHSTKFETIEKAKRLPKMGKGVDLRWLS